MPDIGPTESQAPQPGKKLSPAGLFAILVLCGFLVAAIAYSFHAWNAMPGVQISVAGWIALVLGVFFTLLVGGGLMTLVFYSSRHNYDQ